MEVSQCACKLLPLADQLAHPAPNLGVQVIFLLWAVLQTQPNMSHTAPCGLLRADFCALGSRTGYGLTRTTRNSWTNTTHGPHNANSCC